MDFHDMSQRHSGTGKVRKIRISAGVPSQWESLPESLLQQSDYLRALYVEVTDSNILNKATVGVKLSGCTNRLSYPQDTWISYNEAKQVTQITLYLFGARIVLSCLANHKVKQPRPRLTILNMF